VLKWAAALRSSSDPVLRDAAILVRPHPSRKREWDEVEWRTVPNLALWGDNPIDSESRADYFDSLHYSAAVVGLNTSAFIEAGIVGSPVLAILPEEFRPNQEGTLHFRYLVDGGLLTISRSLADHCGQLASILGGNTEEILRRQRDFVGTFVRPLGVDVSATRVLADAVEELGTMRPPHVVGTPAAVARFGLITLRALARIPSGRKLLLNKREIEGKLRRADSEGREVSWL
jgi:hypothetical protein